jgi:hypothetical protein
VPVKPFPTGVLAGAVTPRKIAEKARAAPKEAAVFFENGAVQQWYKDNGWIYPVQGPSASGLAAVQQFFEALGLTPPPKVRLSINSLSLEGYAGGSLRSSLEVTTPEKRPIYAHGSSDQAWLKVGRPQLKGRTVTLPLAVPAVPNCPGEVLQAKLTVTSNGNQRFEVPISLAIAGSAAAVGAVPVLDMMDVVSAPGPTAARGAWQPAAAPVLAEATPVFELAEAVAAPGPARRTAPVPLLEDLPAGRPIAAPPRLLPLLPIAFLLAGLLGTATHDLITWAFARPTEISSNGGGPQTPIDTTPRITVYFHDEELPVTLGEGGVKPSEGNVVRGDDAFWEPSMRFGLVVNEPGMKSTGQWKRLTFERKGLTPQGLTNNTVVKLDGREYWFGERPFRRVDGKPTFTGPPWPGHWRDMKKALGKDATGRQRSGAESVWEYEKQHIIVTQIVEIVPGPQSNLLDTCLIHYRITNEDTAPHRVGLRFMLDTYIGDNDGVPFLIPGETQLCDTEKIFPTTDVIPDFIQACENENLTNPGTIARIGLKVSGLESPSRVTLGAWPNPELRKYDKGCDQEKTRWNVPVLSMQLLHDSAVAIYWNEQEIPPGEKRDVGLTYGLGSVSSSEGKGRLALTAGGSFAPGGEFTVTAYVSNPTPGQTVTLNLPRGFEFLSGTATQKVPPVPADVASRNSPVTWKVRAAQQAGEYQLRGTTSNGDTQSLPIKIKVPVPGLFGS